MEKDKKIGWYSDNKFYIHHSSDILKNIDKLKKNVYKTLHPKCIVCILFDIKKHINKDDVLVYIEHGFNNPMVNDDQVMLQYDPSLKSYPNNVFTMNRFFYTMHTSKYGTSCTIKISLTRKAIEQLKHLVYNVKHEVGGMLYPTHISRKNGEIVHVLDIRKVNHGESRTVSVDQSLYNFHTHPSSEYKNIKYAWPSSNDVKGFSSLYSNHSILHFVSTVEGLYTIGVSPRCTLQKDRDEVKQSKYNFDKYRNTLSPSQYVKKVNKVKQKCNGKKSPMFQIKFYKWNIVTPGTVFETHFSRQQNQCITIPHLNEK